VKKLTHPAARIVGVWVVSYFAALALYAGITIWKMGGWSPFWHRLSHPHVQGSAFDLLMASLTGTYAIGITVYLGGVAALIVTASATSDRRSSELVASLGNWWLFFPALFWYYGSTLLAGAAIGFPRFAVSVAILIGLGLPALLGFAKAAARAARFIAKDGPLAGDNTAEGSTTTFRSIGERTD
jgi:hypothetical protein